MRAGPNDTSQALGEFFFIVSLFLYNKICLLLEETINYFLHSDRSRREQGLAQMTCLTSFWP